jgi:MFS family permease
MPESPKKPKAKLPETVVALGVVSLLNDAASEMIYPLLPAFIATLGGGPEALGIIEGVADATASLLKLVSGVIADRAGKLKALALGGYAIANVLRPLISLATSWWHVLVVRWGDRIGKGIRTTPRDALLAAATPTEQRGRAFGFHRAMDNAGAFVGSGIAALLLWREVPMARIFAWTAIPGALAVLLLAFWVKDSKAPTVARVEIGLAPSPRYRQLLVAIIVFTLGNSSDAFLLWRARELGVPLLYAPLLWLVLHATKTATSTWGGALSDRLGRRPPILAGWAVYAAVYAGFGFANAAWHAWALFAVYGLYFGLTEGAEKAFIVDLVAPEWRGRALGAYYAAVGLAALPASAAFGAVYKFAGPHVAFSIGAGLAFVAALLLPRPDVGK